MAHLAFLDNFTVPPPPPHPPTPPPYNVGSVRSKCPPWSNIVWGGGGRAKFGKKSRFYHRTGGDNENKANFQGVPYTFDQDCRLYWNIISEGKCDWSFFPISSPELIVPRLFSRCTRSSPHRGRPIQAGKAHARSRELHSRAEEEHHGRRHRIAGQGTGFDGPNDRHYQGGCRAKAQRWVRFPSQVYSGPRRK